MAGSILGTIFKVSTWGESHGAGIGVVVDGCPAGLELCKEEIQGYLNKRKPGQSKFSTPRKEEDLVEILSGVFEGKTTGTPISMMVKNTSQRSGDYSEIAKYYRPGHADYPFEKKYGFRDYRGGGRSSGRETIARVAAGAIAKKLLLSLGIYVRAYTLAIGTVKMDREQFDWEEIDRNPIRMPDAFAAKKAMEFLEEKMKEQDSSGGVIECVIQGIPVGMGEPVFEKLDANLAKAVMSIGAVKGFEIGDGFDSAKRLGSENNDAFFIGEDGKVKKKTNHAGGILGGISDGSEIVFRAAVKPTPSIAKEQQTVNRSGDEITVQIQGRHDPVIVPRAVVVVESMAAITLIDSLFVSMTSQLEQIQRFFTTR